MHVADGRTGMGNCTFSSGPTTSATRPATFSLLHATRRLYCTHVVDGRYLLVRANHFCIMPHGFLLHATHVLHFAHVVDGRGWVTVPPCRGQRQHAQLLRASSPGFSGEARTPLR